MQSLLSLMSKLSSISSHDVIDSEQEISKKAIIPTLRTPFENDKLKTRKEDESQQSLFKFNLSNQQLVLNSPLLDNLPDTLIELDLSNNSLSEFPQQIRKCECLKFLNLCNNFISQLPHKFYLTNLEYLNLSENSIKSLPSGLFKLQFLRGLNLNYNYIDFLPSELFNLKVNNLGLKSNLFTTLPAKFYDIIDTLQIFELDWFDYCAISYELDQQIKQKLLQLCQRVIQRQEIITFSLFYYYMVGRMFDISNFNQYGKNILFTFISRDSTGLLKQYSQKYPELCQQYDEDKCCPIFYALNLKRNKCIQVLLPFYNLNNFEIKCLFLLAIKRMDIQLVKILIQYGIDVNIQIERDIQGPNKSFIPMGSTAMHVVMTSFGRNAQQQQQAQAMVELLLDHESDPNIRNPLKQTSLHAAVKLPSLAAVRFATQKSKFDFHKRDLQKNTPLHSAASQGLVSILQLVQSKNVDPFNLNIYNKTAKQVSIASLQIIKLQRKYEYFYLKKKLLQVNEDYHTNSKNENLITLASNQTISQYQQGTEIRSQILSPQQSQQQRKIFRLNLSQVKLMEQNGLFTNRQQLSSQRSVAPKINELLQKIQLIIRQTNLSNQILNEFRKLYFETQVLQEKLLIIIFTTMLLMKLKHSWKYLSSIATSTISILNQAKIIYEKPNTTQNLFIHECNQQVNKYKLYCSQMDNIDDVDGVYFYTQKNLFSTNLKYNLNNQWRETIKEQEDFYQNSLGEQQWMSCIKGLRIQNQTLFQNSNRILLQQYEQIQNNSLAKTQFMRVVQRQMDYYKEQKVDNSESKGSLSDRMNQYSNVLLTNKKPKLLQTLRYNKMEFYIKNKSQTSRKVSPQVSQHQGEKAQTFRESIWQSKEFSIDN